MTTLAADIVTRAFRRLGIKAEDESLSADQAAHGLDALNDMLFAWRLDGINYTHAQLAGSDPFPLGGEVVAATVALLAAHLAPDYSITVTWDAETPKRNLQAALMAPVQVLRMPEPLMRRSPADGWRR